MKSKLSQLPIGHFGGSLFHFLPLRLLTGLLILALLIVIAVFVEDDFIRPFLGDVLVIMCLYYLINSVINMTSERLALMVVSLAFIIEIAQYFDTLTLLGLNQYTALRIIFGATFDWMDFIAYTIGGIMCITVNTMMNNTTKPATVTKQ
ncbi:DUF2809 domain-containing protein [Aliivibrio fischeri]|uniref:ribosomal maturation YjgA family protein n=1 Tax=Aliivibrio fischeri TaxID=668 RepID=UPI0018C58558|nr:DUF2809 domain-containing protein [Aliivibrio fischeri]